MLNLENITEFQLPWKIFPCKKKKKKDNTSAYEEPGARKA